MRSLHNKSALDSGGGAGPAAEAAPPGPALKVALIGPMPNSCSCCIPSALPPPGPPHTSYCVTHHGRNSSIVVCWRSRVAHAPYVPVLLTYTLLPSATRHASLACFALFLVAFPTPTFSCKSGPHSGGRYISPLF